jgi:hypothetical protein
MAATSTTSGSFTLTLGDEERTLLLTFLDQELHDKQIEVHRTEAFAFRASVEHQVAVLQGLVDKLRRA